MWFSGISGDVVALVLPFLQKYGLAKKQGETEEEREKEEDKGTLELGAEVNV